MKVKIVDPPAGWRYGFPKAVPDDFDQRTEEERVKWFLNEGYPQFEIDRGSLKYCRSWYA